MSWTDEQLTDMFSDDTVGKLAFLTGCYKHSINNSPYDGWIISDDNLRKFAELIVLECVRTLDHHNPYTKDPEAYQYAKVCEHYRRAITRAAAEIGKGMK